MVEDNKEVRGSYILRSTQTEASSNENLILTRREKTRANPLVSMGKMIGTPKPLARSSAMSDTEGTKDVEAMYIKKIDEGCQKGNRATAGKKGKTLNINRQYKEK
jgi:hypothetical protein